MVMLEIEASRRLFWSVGPWKGRRRRVHRRERRWANGKIVLKDNIDRIDPASGWPGIATCCRNCKSKPGAS